MGIRFALTFVFLSGLALGSCSPNRGGGGGEGEGEEGEGEEGEGEIDCDDQDGDGYGAGSECRGDDCDETDPGMSDQCGQDCDEFPERTGCPCDDGDELDCYTGDPATEGVAECHGGARSCDGGVWTGCVGQVAPRPFEMCNDVDDDCDGRVDEGVTNACGTCGNAQEDCQGVSIGPDYGQPFCDEDREDCDGVIETDEGYLTLGETEVNLTNIWIANSSEGTVSKLDTRTGDEIGRFYTGLGDDQADPSRTAVDVDGSVYVANRAFYPPARSEATASVTKIAANEIDCTDGNGNGSIETSDDSVPLPRDTDECVLWTQAIGNPGCAARAMAVDVENGLDGTYASKVYVGCFYDRQIHKLDGSDGTIEDTFDVPNVSPYGFAITTEKQLFVAGLRETYPGGSGTVAIVDLTQNPPDIRYSTPPGCDYEDPIFGGVIPGDPETYGIAADDRGRLWACATAGCILRYQPEEDEWEIESSTACRGIATDGEGFVWCAMGSEVQRWDPDQVEMLDSVATSGIGGVGVAVDFDGKIWVVNQGSSDASRIDPNAMSEDGRFATGTQPYTYSDMTGFQLRNITAPSGRYSRVFELCDDAASEWSGLGLDIDLPPGTSIAVRVRTGETIEEIETAEWIDLGVIQNLDDRNIVFPDEVSNARYLQVELTLHRDPEAGGAPILRGFTVLGGCEVFFG